MDDGGSLFKKHVVNQITHHVAVKNTKRIYHLNDKIDILKRIIDNHDLGHKVTRRYLSSKERNRVQYQPVWFFWNLILFAIAISALILSIIAIS